jgi:hypothetical protein
VHGELRALAEEVLADLVAMGAIASAPAPAAPRPEPAARPPIARARGTKVLQAFWRR